MLSPIKESRRENGSNQELRCSPERWSITSASPTHSASSDMNGGFGYSPKVVHRSNSNNTASLERYQVLYEENGTKYRAFKKGPDSKLSRNFTVESQANYSSAPASPTTKLLNTTITNGVKRKGSSRIR